MPYFDSSGWFLIEKTTILTNSCCLYVQPTFGYAQISDTIAVSMPYFDSSGWFLIEKTTILTNSCCLYVQPTFGYLTFTKNLS